MNYLKLHPKIKAAALAAGLVAVVTVGNSFVEAYPQGVVSQLVALLVVLAAGYQKKA